jgi:glutathione S-transferase
VPFEISCIDINKGQNRTPEYLELNPRGQVPVLKTGNKVFRESAAIAIYLADKHISALLPDTELERLKALEWLEFYNSSLQQAYGSYFLMSKNLKDENAKQASCDLAARRIGFLWREIEAHLSNHRYLCGENLTLADIFHAVIANWTSVISPPITLGPNILRLCKEVTELPFFQKAMHAEDIRYSLPNA